MPQWEVDMIQQTLDSEARSEEASIHNKMEKHDIEKRLNLLFGPDKNEELASMDKGQRTVNEEATTDTAFDSEFEREAAIRDDTFKDVKMPENYKEQFKSAKTSKFASGIQSSGDEANIQSASSSSSDQSSESDSLSSEEEVAAAKYQPPTINTLKPSRFDEARAIDDFKARDAQENTFRYSEEDIAKFTKNLKLQDYRDKDYASKTPNFEDELLNLDAKTEDMQGMNLFGVAMKAFDDTTTIDNETNQVLQDLVQLTSKLDPEGLSMDFTKRKSFNYYDPYNEEANEYQYSMLRWADKDDVYRASLVIDQFRNQLWHLNRELKHQKRNFIERERMDQCVILLDRLSQVKIIDAPVLLKLYDLYRYRPEN